MMHFRLLGPLRVYGTGEQELRIARPKVRHVLAILLARANSRVSLDSLVDELWGAEPPSSARSNVRTYVAALRKLLSPAEPAAAVISTDPRGYRMEVPVDSVDILSFERLASEGAEASRRGDQALAVARFEAALSLWRGPAFQDVPLADDALLATAQRLEERRLTTVEELSAAHLALGRHTEIVGELQSWVVQYPWRERLWEHLMLALYRAGRQADALVAYQRLHRRLVEEVGVEPSRPLRELQGRILKSDPALALPAGVVVASARPHLADPPRQLPLDVSTFVGRNEEMRTLLTFLDPGDAVSHSRVVVIHGPPGVGKSALAIRAASFRSPDFPDGQLYVNLRGATPGVDPLTPGAALGRLLRALGVAAADVPNDAEEAAALFRSLVADRRLLILLDNAASAGQVRPLLAGGAGTAVLVASRAGLTALDDAVHLHLGPLDASASQAMLECLVGDGRAAAEPHATARLAELCGHLPLGLHVAASRLKARPNWSIDRLVDRLTDERHRLTELTAGDLAVRSSLSVSYTALHRSGDAADRATAHAFRLLGLLPTTDIHLGTAAALFDSSPAKADLVIERLLDAHLLEAVAADRYRMHDLVRLFTQELATDTVPVAEAAAALCRVLTHYLITTRGATALVYRNRSHYAVGEPNAPTADGRADGPCRPAVAIEPTRFAGPTEARDWLTAERENMLALIRRSWSGPHEQARLGVQLALALHWFFYLDCSASDWIDVAGESVVVAERLGETHLLAYAHGSVAAVLALAGRLEEASTHLAAEVSLCREIGDRFGEQRALGNLGNTYLRRGDPTAAIEHLQLQLAVAREIGAAIGEAYALMTLGQAHHQLGRYDDAVSLTESALAWFEEAGDDFFTCTALEVLGLIHRERGHLGEAVATLTRSVECARRAQFGRGEADSLVGLAESWRRLGAPDKALRYAREAVAVTERLAGASLRSRACAEYVAALEAAASRPQTRH